MTKNVLAVILWSLAPMGHAVPPQDTQVPEQTSSCDSSAGLPHLTLRDLAPKYSIENRVYDTSQPPVLDMQIRIPTEAFYGGALVGLGCKLAADFPKEHAIRALIFDDRKAAHNLATGLTDQRHWGTYVWHLRAYYELDRDKKRQFIEFLVPHVQRWDHLPTYKRYKIWIPVE